MKGTLGVKEPLELSV